MKNLISDLVFLLCLAGATLLLLALCGCRSLPEGMNLQSSVVGLKLAPLGDMPQAPKLLVGSATQSYSTPPKADAGPGLNRQQTIAPGIDQTSTVAVGPVGAELEKAKDVLPGAIQALHSKGPGQILPLPVANAPLEPAGGKTKP